MNSETAAALLRRLVPDLHADANEHLVEDIALLATYKYDNFEMYGPGQRFFEHLFRWLDQFKKKERLDALRFLRNRLIFISRREMQVLTGCVFYDVVIPRVLEHIIATEGLQPFAYAQAYDEHFRSYLRRCLFVGLSDSAHIDFFRRQNDLDQEQVLPVYRVNPDDCMKALRRESKSETATFWGIFLLEDFAGSGYTLLHKEPSAEHGFAGALMRVLQNLRPIVDTCSYIATCHYICTDQAFDHITESIELLRDARVPNAAKLSYSTILRISQTHSVKPADTRTDPIAKMCVSYYKETFETDETKKRGGVKFGFGGIGLPLVMYANTPNNTIPLVWAEGRGDFRALFKRVDRHKDKAGRQT